MKKETSKVFTMAAAKKETPVKTKKVSVKKIADEEETLNNNDLLLKYKISNENKQDIIKKLIANESESMTLLLEKTTLINKLITQVQESVEKEKSLNETIIYITNKQGDLEGLLEKEKVVNEYLLNQHETQGKELSTELQKSEELLKQVAGFTEREYADHLKINDLRSRLTTSRSLAIIFFICALLELIAKYYGAN